MSQSGYGITHREDASRIRTLFADILQNKPGKTSDRCRHQRTDGSYRWISFTAENKLDEPALNGVLLTNRDMDDANLTETRPLG
ncbi:MAG: PAS domain-containing protein [Spirochaetaceae bacterium]